jgi:D-alanyl-D-alanine dipeptidase
MIDKIAIIYYILYSLLMVLPECLSAQSDAKAYGVNTINRKNQYLLSVKGDASKRMVELKRLAPSLVYDLRYADTNNFTRQRMYPRGTRQTFLREPAAVALQAVQQELTAQQLGLKIFDAYRPYSVTVKFWELIGDERYVARPTKGSGHNRGLAVDLTLIEAGTGKELDMGTGFDNFSDTASHQFISLPEKIMANRKRLKDVMLKHGFQLLDTEWWHYNWPNDKNYEVLDLPFKDLR